MSVFFAPEHAHGYHAHAYDEQVALFRAVAAKQRRRKFFEGDTHPVEALDYGSGWQGVSRVILEGVLSAREQLFLYDRFAAIKPSGTPNVHQATAKDIFSGKKQFSIISISYVICCMAPQEARTMLAELQEAQQSAQYVIVDYTLRDRTREEVLALLTSNQEMKWRRHMGEDAFAQTRMQHTPQSLVELVESAGLRARNGKAAPMDPAGLRSAIVAEAQENTPPCLIDMRETIGRETRLSLSVGEAIM
ncbi:MAG: hypothetical protein PHU04_01670 [Candidatus Peribacteraceae bacterium]|nr:hypothetical protein [Candidatus Peribacteraceae bacterium]